jgi:hypothetical protein
VCLAFVLSINDIGAVISGKDTDPIVTLLRAAMGETGFRAVIVVVLVSFVSCLLSLQAAASRLIFAYARDQMIFGSKYLSRMSPGNHMCPPTRWCDGGHSRADRALGPVAAGRHRHHHQLRGRRHLYFVPNDRLGRADRAHRKGGGPRGPLPSPAGDGW